MEIQEADSTRLVVNQFDPTSSTTVVNAIDPQDAERMVLVADPHQPLWQVTVRWMSCCSCLLGRSVNRRLRRSGISWSGSCAGWGEHSVCGRLLGARMSVATCSGPGVDA